MLYLFGSPPRERQLPVVRARLGMKDHKPREIAEGVYWLRFAVVSGNVYFVKSGSSWALIDTAFARSGQRISTTAEALFGAGARPSAIFLTHMHPDHSGSALELARLWGCPVYVHPHEMPLAVVRDIATVKQFANPIDRWIVLPLLRLMPRHRVTAMLSKESLEGVARALDPAAAVPGLPEWRSITTPGHSPGIGRRADDRRPRLVARVPVLGFSAQQAANQRTAVVYELERAAVESSVAALSRLRPRVLASGHGVPMAGDETAELLCAYAERHGIA